MKPEEQTARQLPFIGLYAVYFCAWGLFVPYFSLFLASSGYSRSDVSWVLALYPLITIVAPPVFGYWVDRRFDRRKSLSVLLTLGGVVFWLFLLKPPTWALYLVMVCFALFFTPILSLFDAMTLRSVRPAYGVVRSAGTFAFMVIAVAGGVLYSWLELWWLMTMIPVFTWLAAVVVLRVPDLGAPDRLEGGQTIALGEVWLALRGSKLLPLLVFGLLHWMGMAPYHNLFSVYLEEMIERQGLSYGPSLIGISWGLSTITEFALFLLSNRLIARLGERTLLISVVVFSLIRWTIFALATPVWAIMLGQTLHCFVFAAFYVVSTRMVASRAPSAMRNSFQTLWAGVVLGFGGWLGGMITGFLADRVAIEHLYWFAALSSLVSAIPLVRFLGAGRRVGREVCL